jgi:hypothetical protein
LTALLNINQQLVAPRSPFDVYWDLLHDPQVMRRSTLLEEERRKGEEGEETFEAAHQRALLRTYDHLSPLLDELENKGIVRVTCVLGCAVYPVHHLFNHR